MSDTNTTEVVMDEIKLTKNIPMPKKNYVLRCTEEEYKSSSKGNMMIEREWEVVDPSEVVYNGKKLILAGTTMKKYTTCIVMNEDGTVNDVKSAKCKSMLREEYSMLGFDTNVDPANPLAKNQAKGMLVDAICASEEYTQCEDLTAEQKAKGDRQGSPILDRNTGKPLRGYRPQIREILGVSSFKPTNPY